MGLAERIARAILDGFDARYRAFRQTAAEAKGRFERAEWDAVRAASRERIDHYDRRVNAVVRAIAEEYPSARVDETLWPQVKRAYIALLYDHRQPECAETFYNSVACRALDRTYYRNEYIFWRPAVSTEYADNDEPTYRCYYPTTQGFRRSLRSIIEDFGLRVPFEDLARDLRYVVRTLRAEFDLGGPREPNFHVQVLASLFYRNANAYIVGRVVNGNDLHPFAVAIRHVPQGGALHLDALLLSAAEVGRLFNVSRAYFTVDMQVPWATVRFLRSLMPAHTGAELYTAVGLQKQGKTMFYRDLQEHLKHSTDRFAVAPGVKGLVMLVFTLPSFPFVFKVMRDVFRPPKQSTHADVQAKYQMVKLHDRVGRMADTLEYSSVAFPVERLAPALLAELESECGGQVERDGDRVVVAHLYIERRMTPLDLYLRDADEAAARRVITEFSVAVKELAAADVFPGDILSKNFGVTRAGRVVFYDYDEISTLDEVAFRRLPAPRNDLEELSAEPWFHVGPHDVFPEEWMPFVLPSPRDRRLLLEISPELLDADWWAARQAERRQGRSAEVLPYPERTRFGVRYGAVPTG
jgi:isocitrate dehydrogenase kinase/phosphatase